MTWEKEIDHVRETLGYNSYPDWLLAETREEIKKKREEQEMTSVTPGMKREDKKRPHFTSEASPKD